ncbi:MAG: hypothetical protein OEQ13_10995, partial [Acidobacteriota bacterium]|nr:hypothetical protein [Acidobacteriota bacterium]
VEAIHGRGRWRSLRVRRARGFALGAAAISAAGHAAFVVAGAVDRALGRTVPSVGAPSWDRRLCTRRMAWWLQRAAQLIWHAMLDRICHPSIQDPVVSPKSTQRAESRS